MVMNRGSGGRDWGKKSAKATVIPNVLQDEIAISRQPRCSTGNIRPHERSSWALTAFGDGKSSIRLLEEQ